MNEEQPQIPSAKSEVLAFVWETIKVVVISLAIILPIRYYLVQPFFVKGASMEPNFEDGEYLIIDEISYYFKKPVRGDVVVFYYPLDTSRYYIKRIIGLPGETVEIKNGDIIIYNGEHPEGLLIQETYLPQNLTTGGDINKKISNGEYFVLGDNRLNSSDSRIWGALPEKDVIGRVLLRAWPFGRAGIFEAPNY